MEITHEAIIPGERLTHLLGSCSLRNRKADSKNGISTKIGLVWGTVELDQELVNLRLVLNIDVLLNQGRANDFVDIGDCLEDTFPTPLALISIAELACLMLTYCIYD